jgi:uncharacterized damage-inducible protein DinB
MSLDNLIDTWREVRSGLIDEMSLIPEDRFSFKATSDTRSIEEVLKHIIGAQKVLVSEMCRSDTNLRREPVPGMLKRYAPELETAGGKAGLIDLLGKSMDWAADTLRSYGIDALQEPTQRFDGKTTTKFYFLNFMMAHEMYHRGQLTVFERLLGIEPALTARFNRLAANS